MAKAIMIQGTMSNAGKSLLTAGLCRIFKQDGYRVAPFKSQNMALNSFITREGLEMGRAQVVQAQAAGTEPMVCMNPILLKPSSDTGSQVIVNGVPIKTMAAGDYFRFKKELIPVIREAYETLDREYDIIVIEGAGSPAEINLKQDDIVNMGMAKMAGAPVLLAGDIDRGGVFAQLYGTVMLLEQDEREFIKGMIINKFRGDKKLLDPGVEMIEKLVGIPVVGVTPYLQVDIEDEDSLSSRLDERSGGEIGGDGALGRDNGASRRKIEPLLDIAVIRFPRLSNFTDFAAFDRMKGIRVRYVGRAGILGNPDLIILPGTKNTVEDLLWMRQNGLEGEVLKQAARQTPVFGICGGYQMMGTLLLDEKGAESGRSGTSLRGMGLFGLVTEFEEEKTRTRVRGRFLETEGVLKGLSGLEFEGYEIHMGHTGSEKNRKSIRPAGNLSRVETEPVCEKMKIVLPESKEAPLAKLWEYQARMNPNETSAAARLQTPGQIPPRTDGFSRGNLYGTYVHGIFDTGAVAEAVITALAERKGLDPAFLTEDGQNYEDYREIQFNLLADGLRANLDMERIYGILEKGMGQV